MVPAPAEGGPDDPRAGPPALTKGGSSLDHLQYLGLLAACVVVTLPLEFVFRARVWRRPRRLAYALIPTVIVFAAWDVWAIARGHWRFNDRFISGITLPGKLPIEELMFFVVVPVCGLLTFEAVRNLLGRR